MTKVEFDKRLEELKSKYREEEAILRSEFIEKERYEKRGNINLMPLRETLLKKGETLLSFCREIGWNYHSLATMIDGNSGVFTTGKIAQIASYLKVPISQVVEFRGYEIKPEFSSKYGVIEVFEVPEVILGEPSYQPLKDLVKSFYKDKEEKKTLGDLFDKIEPQKDGRQSNKGNLEGLRKGLIKRGIDPDNPKHEKFKRPGMSDTIRSKITHDKSVNTHLIYKICKLLQCNVDFVFGWK